MADPKWLIDEEAQHERDAECLAKNMVNSAHAIGSHRGLHIPKWEDQSDDERDLMLGVAHHLLRFRIVQMVHPTPPEK